MHNKESDPRSIAIKIFISIENGLTIQSALNKELLQSSLSRQNISLCTELIYGYTRYAIRINHILSKFLKSPSKLPKIMILTMGFAIYEILFLEKIPEYASISYAVKKVRKLFGQKMAGIVNAVLRNIVLNKNAVLLPKYYSNQADFYSVSSWLYDVFLKSRGQQSTHKILNRSLLRPKPAIRLNPFHPLFEKCKNNLDLLENCEPVGFSGYVFHEKKPDLVCNTNFEKLHSMGVFSWQSAGSQKVLAQCFKNVPDLSDKPFVDLCAGQGGKTFILLEQGISVKLASDTSFQRLSQLKLTAQRLGIKTPILICQSGVTALKKLSNCNIILDVPCSGFGTLSRRPEIRIRRKEQDISEYISLQKVLLNNSWDMLCANAHIIYITCTLNIEENHNLINGFLKNKIDAILEYEWETPHEDEWLEGMYAAVLRKV